MKEYEERTETIEQQKALIRERYGQFNSKAGVIQFSMLETSPSMQQNTEWSEQTL